MRERSTRRLVHSQRRPYLEKCIGPLTELTYGLYTLPAHLNGASSPQLREEVAFFQQWGYLVVDDALTSEQVDALRTALDATFAQSNEQFIHQLLECDEAFAFLARTTRPYSRA